MLEFDRFDERPGCDVELLEPGLFSVVELLSADGPVQRGRVELGLDGDSHDVVEIVERAPEKVISVTKLTQGCGGSSIGSTLGYGSIGTVFDSH